MSSSDDAPGYPRSKEGGAPATSSTGYGHSQRPQQYGAPQTAPGFLGEAWSNLLTTANPPSMLNARPGASPQPYAQHEYPQAAMRAQYPPGSQPQPSSTPHRYAPQQHAPQPQPQRLPAQLHPQSDAPAHTSRPQAAPETRSAAQFAQYQAQRPGRFATAWSSSPSSSPSHLARQQGGFSPMSGGPSLPPTTAVPGHHHTPPGMVSYMTSTAIYPPQIAASPSSGSPTMSTTTHKSQSTQANAGQTQSNYPPTGPATFPSPVPSSASVTDHNAKSSVNRRVVPLSASQVSPQRKVLDIASGRSAGHMRAGELDRPVFVLTSEPASSSAPMPSTATQLQPASVPAPSDATAVSSESVTIPSLAQPAPQTAPAPSSQAVGSTTTPAVAHPNATITQAQTIAAGSEAVTSEAETSDAGPSEGKKRGLPSGTGRLQQLAAAREAAVRAAMLSEGLDPDAHPMTLAAVVQAVEKNAEKALKPRKSSDAPRKVGRPPGTGKLQRAREAETRAAIVASGLDPDTVSPEVRAGFEPKQPRGRPRKNRVGEASASAATSAQPSPAITAPAALAANGAPVAATARLPAAAQAVAQAATHAATAQPVATAQRAATAQPIATTQTSTPALVAASTALSAPTAPSTPSGHSPAPGNARPASTLPRRIAPYPPATASSDAAVTAQHHVGSTLADYVQLTAPSAAGQTLPAATSSNPSLRQQEPPAPSPRPPQNRAVVDVPSMTMPRPAAAALAGPSETTAEEVAPVANSLSQSPPLPSPIVPAHSRPEAPPISHGQSKMGPVNRAQVVVPISSARRAQLIARGVYDAFRDDAKPEHQVLPRRPARTGAMTKFLAVTVPRGTALRQQRVREPEAIKDRFSHRPQMLAQFSSVLTEESLLNRLGFNGAYSCEWKGCEAELASESLLKRHIEIRDHAGQSASNFGNWLLYQCHWRGCLGQPAFRTVYKLLQHITAKHVSERLVCPYGECTLRSTSISHLYRHVSRTHDDDGEEPRPRADLPFQPPAGELRPLPHWVTTVELTTQRATGRAHRTERHQEHVHDKVLRMCVAPPEPNIQIIHPPHMMEPLGDEDGSLITTHVATEEGVDAQGEEDADLETEEGMDVDNDVNSEAPQDLEEILIEAVIVDNDDDDEDYDDATPVPDARAESTTPTLEVQPTSSVPRNKRKRVMARRTGASVGADNKSATNGGPLTTPRSSKGVMARRSGASMGVEDVGSVEPSNTPRSSKRVMARRTGANAESGVAVKEEDAPPSSAPRVSKRQMARRTGPVAEPFPVSDDEGTPNGKVKANATGKGKGRASPAVVTPSRPRRSGRFGCVKFERAFMDCVEPPKIDTSVY